MLFYVTQFSDYYEFKVTHAFSNHSVPRVSLLRPSSYALTGENWSCSDITCFISHSVAVRRLFKAASEKEDHTFSWGNAHIFSQKSFLKVDSLPLDSFCFSLFLHCTSGVCPIMAYLLNVSILHDKRRWQWWNFIAV